MFSTFEQKYQKYAKFCTRTNFLKLDGHYVFTRVSVTAQVLRQWSEVDEEAIVHLAMLNSLPGLWTLMDFNRVLT